MIHDVLSGRMSAGVGRGADRDSTRASLASAQRDVTGSLSLVTREGDTVTLSASYDASVTYAGARRGRGDGGFRAAGAQVSQSFSLQVQGNLSRMSNAVEVEIK